MIKDKESEEKMMMMMKRYLMLSCFDFGKYW